MSRVTRSQTRHQDRQKTEPTTVPTWQTAGRSHRALYLKDSLRAAHRLTELRFPTDLVQLKKADRRLLLFKRERLQNPDASASDFNLLKNLRAANTADPLARSTAAALIFAGEAAGTAVCISPDGLILTCAHCIAKSEAEYKKRGARWLLFASGDPVKAECVAWDSRRDLALLQITASLRSDYEQSAEEGFPHAEIAERPPRPQTRLICVGHPGSEDFEADRPGVPTGYDVLHASEGRFRGLAKGQDPQDNSEIGALMHDCWTYWGHSGAPLIARATGNIVGLHSSWDDATGMRRGVAWEAIRSFLAEHTTRDRSSS